MRLDYEYLTNSRYVGGEELKLTLEEQKLSGSLKDIDNMMEMKNKLLHFVNFDNDTFKDQIFSITESLNDKVGNNWSYHLFPANFNNFDSSYFLYVHILYPEITIVSENGGNHLIKNINVVFQLTSRNSNISLERLEGCRATVSTEEYDSGYQHSHLDTKSYSQNDSIFNTNDFCLGDDTAMNNILVDFRDNNYQFSKDKFESFLYLIDSVLEWESIDGVPYIEIDQIRKKCGYSLPSSMYDVERLYERSNFKNYTYKVIEKIDFRLLNKKYSIKNLDKLTENIKKVIIEFISDLTPYLIEKSINTGYMSINLFSVAETHEIEHRDDFYIIVGEKKLNFTVDSLDDEIDKESIIRNAIIYPKFLDYVKKEIEKELYKKAVRRKIIKKSSKNINA